MDGGLRSLFRRHLPDFDYQSIEVSFDRGIPDTNFCYRGIEGWIEHKWTEDLSVEISPEQVAWISRRVRHGGRVFIAVRRRTKKRKKTVDELWLIEGNRAGRLWEEGLSPGLARGFWEGGPKAWDWPAIGAIILEA